MNRLPEHPLAAMLVARQQRAPHKPLQWSPWLLGVLLIPPLMVYGGQWMAVLGVLLVGARPAALAAEQASLLLSLRHKDCLGELLSCSTSPAEMVDGLVFHSVKQMARAWPWALLSWIYALAWVGGTRAALLAPLGVLAQLVLAAVLSYLAQGGAAWSRAEDDVLPRHLLLWLLAAPFLAAAGYCLTHDHAPLAAASLLIPGISLRALAILGLTHYTLLQHWLAQRWQNLKGAPGNGEAATTDNPIVYREARAEAGRVPGGFVGLMVWRHGLTAVLVSGLALASLAERSNVAQWSFLVVIVLLQTLRAAFRTVGALVDEQEGKTLEGLVLTDLAPRQWVDGWAQVGWLPRTQENLVIGIGLVMLAAPQGFPLWRLLLAATLLVTLPSVAAYSGVLTSTLSGSRQQAYDRLGLELSKLWVVGVLGLLACLMGPALLSWVGVAAAARLLMHLRGRALAAVTRPLGRVTLAQVTEKLMGESLRQVAPSGSKSRLMERLELEGLVS